MTAIIITVIAALIIWYLEFRAYSIPVLYYHHVEPTDPISPEVFEAQMKYLLSKGYRSISLHELYEFIHGKAGVRRKSFVLTFDDGFYCNYHYLFPLLKKYNLKAAIFVVSGVRNQSEAAQHREDVRGYPSRMGTNKEAGDKFATWDELKLMIASGLIEIEDHSLFHDRIYINDTVQGFNTGIELDWGIWGDRRQGSVKYKTGPYLVHKNFTGDYKLNDYLVDMVRENNLDPSERKSMDTLKRMYIGYKQKYPVRFVYESQENYRSRCKTDIDKSRQTIEGHTGIKPAFFCFPWGKYNKTLIILLKELGYSGSITTDKGANVKGGNPYKIRRFKVYRSNINWFKRYFFLHRSRLLITLYSLIYGIF